jgi:energy-coupling factor transporter transmembrane protein EcfT
LILKVIFTFYCCLLLMLSLFKSAEVFLPAIYQFQGWLGGDKLMHLKLALVLSVLACVAASNIKKRFPLHTFWRVLLMQSLLASCLLLDEAHQYFATSRRFEWLDFYYGAGGLLIGVSVYCCFLGVKVAYRLVLKTDYKPE